ncbi:uncharacterized protein LOC108607783 [Drosophila busckii]|uniref:uncharacterized protein LOC108607783 n=1 Tax=Drosophila busckii TaxID=30019 RepID=UPI001432E34C|nr:uncharacterized protein LOC108607783 [Drosophila busckii]
MWYFHFALMLSLLPLALFQSEDSHLCVRDEDVQYSVVENTPLEEYSPRFAAEFKKLNIAGARRTVTKTKKEARKVCCPGYFKDDESAACLPLPTTTSTETSSTEESTTEISTERTTQYTLKTQRNSTDWNNIFICGSALLLCLLIIVIATIYVTRYVRYKKSVYVQYTTNANANGHELEAQEVLVCEDGYNI